MTAAVLAFRAPFYAVTPGEGTEEDPEPIAYERTLDGAASAIEHASLLSARGGRQDITLTQGRTTTVIRQFEGGRDITGDILPPAYPTVFRPASEDIRPGSPHGHIPETCTTAKHRAAGGRPRRNRNMPKPYWPGVI